LTVPVPGNRTVTARMRDNLHYSAFMVYPEGVVYGGQSVIEVPISMLESIGLTEPQARALEYASTHEGKYDAINSYDAGIFSFGFIQFVGASQHGGSLNRLLAAMKANAPAGFARTFQSVGIDTDQNTTTVLDDSGRLLRGDDAWFYIQKNVQLYGAFIQAGYDPALVMEQLRAANTLYVQPALNSRLDITINGIRTAIPRLGEMISSEALLTALIAIAINRGTGFMSRMVADTVATLAAPLGLNSPEALRAIDERAVLQTIADTTMDTRTRNRALGVLQAGLSFEKGWM
jgi:peptidoglycan endopeptidase LytF